MTGRTVVIRLSKTSPSNIPQQKTDINKFNWFREWSLNTSTTCERKTFFFFFFVKASSVRVVNNNKYTIRVDECIFDHIEPCNHTLAISWLTYSGLQRHCHCVLQHQYIVRSSSHQYEWTSFRIRLMIRLIRNQSAIRGVRPKAKMSFIPLRIFSSTNMLLNWPVAGHLYAKLNF